MSNSTPPPTEAKPITSTMIWAGVAVIVAVIAGVVGLSFAGWKTESITGVVGVIGIAVSALLGALGKLIHDQNQTLSKIEHQTNGELKKNVREAIRAELSTEIPDPRKQP